jgi:hypothetical protein
MNLPDFEIIVGIVQSIATVIAIIVGGIWSYMLFVSRRQRYPRTKIEHQVVCRNVVDGKLILSIDVTITNSSDVLLSLISWEINAKQMLPPKAELARFLIRESIGKFPCGPQIIEWHSIAVRKDQWKKGKFEIEPGEQHQIHSDFLIDSDIQTILVESYFRNVEKRGKQIGWTLTTIHDLHSCLIGG